MIAMVRRCDGCKDDVDDDESFKAFRHYRMAAAISIALPQTEGNPRKNECSSSKKLLKHVTTQARDTTRQMAANCSRAVHNNVKNAIAAMCPRADH